MKASAQKKLQKENLSQLVINEYEEFANASLEFLSEGWDNSNFKLGKNYILRLPKRSDAEKLLKKEIKWLPLLQDQLPIPISAPVKSGSASTLYPYCWCIVPYFSGETADQTSLFNEEVIRWTEFLKKLHSNSPFDGPENPYRACHLIDKAADVEKRMVYLDSRSDLITPTLRELWEKAINTPTNKNRCLIHGDLHPQNIIAKDQRIEAVIDWGDLCLGDPAVDLASLWMLFRDQSVRKEALVYYGASQELINRSIGWAIFFATVFLEAGWENNEQYVKMGKQILFEITLERGK